MYHAVEVAGVAIQITDPSQVGEARRSAKTIGEACGLSAENSGRLALIASEAATNLIKHAGGGEILIQPAMDGHTRSGVEILVLDHGPGICDLAMSMRDGFSTAGSMGTGLGAIQRASDFFEVYSAENHGTSILCRVMASGAKPEANGTFKMGAVSIAMPGESVCGDGWMARLENRCLQILVSDGLGHGISAHAASAAAVATFNEYDRLATAAIMEQIHNSLRSTRGAAGAIAEIDFAGQQMRFTGIGNITATILDGKGRRNAVSHYGTLGHQVRKFQEFSYPWSGGAMLVMHSDGLANRWSFDDYPGLAQRDPSLIAGVLYRDFGRNRDDTSIIVVKGDG